MTMKYISYARFSTDNQRDTSVDDQHFQNLAKFAELGIPEDQVTKINDMGITAAHDDRPGYQRVDRAIKAGEVKILVVNDQSRWTRDLDIGDWLNKFKFYETRFIAIDDNHDTDIEGTELSAQVKGWQNHQFLKDHAKKVRRGLAGRARDPNGATGDHPYGYRTEWADPVAGEQYTGNGPKPMRKTVIFEEEAAVVREVFQAFVVDGLSLTKIARLLNARKVSPASGRPPKPAGQRDGFASC